MHIFLVNFAFQIDMEEALPLTMDSMTEVGAPFASFELAHQSILRHYAENCHSDTPLAEIKNPVAVREKLERIFEGTDRTSGTVRYVIVEKVIAEEVTTDPLDFFGYGLT